MPPCHVEVVGIRMGVWAMRRGRSEEVLRALRRGGVRIGRIGAAVMFGLLRPEHPRDMRSRGSEHGFGYLRYDDAGALKGALGRGMIARRAQAAMPCQKLRFVVFMGFYTVLLP